MSTATRAERFHRARRDPDLTVLEGFHALKHALRFGAEVLETSAVAPKRVVSLCEKLAPDLVERFAAAITDTVTDEELARLVPRPPFTGIVAIARRRAASPDDVLAAPGPAAAIALIAPRHAGNLGAAVRVAAAAGAAGLVSVGGRDPWEPEAVRGAAGLQFALPVSRVDALPATDRPLVAVDPAGVPLSAGALPERPLLAFGSERDGLGADVLSRADLRIAIPMRTGVSSLNLATAVAVMLYAERWRG